MPLWMRIYTREDVDAFGGSVPYLQGDLVLVNPVLDLTIVIRQANRQPGPAWVPAQ